MNYISYAFKTILPFTLVNISPTGVVEHPIARNLSLLGSYALTVISSALISEVCGFPGSDDPSGGKILRQ